MEDTENIFWSNLEAGLSLLAVNLPSLWAIATSASATRLLAGLRSLIRLRSQVSPSRIPDGGTAPDPDNSQVRIPEICKESSEEWHKMYDFQRSEAWPSPSVDSDGSAKTGIIRHDEIV